MSALVRIFSLIGIVAMLAAGPALSAAVDEELGANEVKMGEEAVAEIVKQCKMSDNAADLKHLRDMGDKIAAFANKDQVNALYGSPQITPFNYTFDIVEEDDVNAFSVPGGRIFVYRGLLNFVESDQELAGVLAHEIIHASHHHMVFLLRKMASINNVTAIALLAAMLSGARSTDISNIYLGVQLFQIAKLNGYGMQAEREADQGAVYYMVKSGNNPVGLLTFLERLAKRPELVDYGIYRSHPLDADRVKAARKLIQELGLPINRRDTTAAIKAVVKTQKIGEVDQPTVVIRDTVIFIPAPQDGKSARQRADETAARINAALDAGIKMYELRVDTTACAVIARGQVLLSVSEDDAELMGKTPAQVTQIAGNAIRDIVWKQMVDTVH